VPPGREASAGRNLGFGVGVLLVAVGALVSSAPLSDSSFFTHLATGRIIWDGGGFPHHDPYTFTAAGEPWVVQSWLASVLYAGLEDLLGLQAVRLLLAATGGAITAALWALTRPAGTLTGRLLVALPALAVGLDGWSERPLLFGLACLGAALLAAEGHLDPRWLLPVTWVWANVHGSWPLGVVALGLLALGRRLDGGDPAVELRSLAWMAGGLALAIANPYGPRLLAFPIELLGRREALAELQEWQPPTFGRPSEQFFLLLVAVAVLALVKRRSWRAALPLVVFVVAAATGARNVLPAALVLVPGAAWGLAGFGSIAADRPHRLAGRLAALGGVVGALTVLVAVTGEPLQEGAYPVAADRWLRDNGLSPVDHRVVAREVVGNWWELRDGPTQHVFIDDRIEVVPLAVVLDHAALLDGDEGWQAILARYGAEAVLWEADAPLAAELADDPAWAIAYRDDRFVVAVPATG
jgi:hypothetical protein